MITDQDIQQSRTVIQRLIKEGQILPADQKYVSFFLAKTTQSLETAHSLLLISSNSKLKETLELPSSYEGYAWVINASYYAMFYAATALLAKYNHRIKTEQGIHVLTYRALIYYFLDNDRKLPKHILEQYQQAEMEASELLQLTEHRAREHIEQVKFELIKRREFTYEMGKVAISAKTETSISRAQEFVTLVKELLV